MPDINTVRKVPVLNGIYWLLLGCALVIALGVIFAANNLFYSEFQATVERTPPPAITHPKPILVTIEFGTSKTRAFKGTPDSGMTAYAALAASADVGKFQIATDDNGNITEIAGTKATKTHSWRFYLNGSLLDNPPGNIDVKAGDIIAFRYQ